MPLVVALLIGITFVLSLAAAVLSRNGVPVLEHVVLSPPAVWHGQVWRLFTWQLFELDPINLVFACLMLYWFGRDLCVQWGTARFLAVYFGCAAVSGALTCVVGRFLWHDVWGQPFLGVWVVTDALTLAWAALYPDREIFLGFILPVSGKMLIWITVGGTILYAAFVGFSQFVPHLIAELLMLAYVSDPRRRLMRWRLGRLEHQRRSYLKSVARADRDEDEHGPPSGKPPRWMN